MQLLNQTLAMAGNPDAAIACLAQDRVNNLIKPRGSLGALEDYYVRLAAMQGTLTPSLGRRAVVVMCGDHGIVDEGVATGLQSVTLIQAKNFVRGVTGVCTLARQSNTEVIPVDVGIAADFDEPGIRNEKVRYGTANFSRGPAMTRMEAIASIEVGIRVATDLFSQGYTILATGEMGIGNTSASAAMLAVFSGIDVAELTGVGANLPEEKLAHKIAVIRRGLEINHPKQNDPLGVLAAVGGLEIGAMAGVMLAGAACARPVIVDGFISSVSAVLARRLLPGVETWLFASHRSQERGAQLASILAGVEPVLDLGLRLGEGSGAVLLFPLLEAACLMGSGMATFDESGILPV